ncbi:MAG: hypothetical protein ACQESR_02665 [Planctomycetota bacterium]
MESCPTQAVRPVVGLAAEKVIRDRYNWTKHVFFPASQCVGWRAWCRAVRILESISGMNGRDGVRL